MIGQAGAILECASLGVGDGASKRDATGGRHLAAVSQFDARTKATGWQAEASVTQVGFNTAALAVTKAPSEVQRIDLYQRGQSLGVLRADQGALDFLGPADQAVDRRDDVGISNVESRLAQLRLGLQSACLGRKQSRLRCVGS